VAREKKGELGVTEDSFQELRKTRKERKKGGEKKEKKFTRAPGIKQSTAAGLGKLS